MGGNICGCNNDQEQGNNESDVIFKYNIKPLFLLIQFSKNQLPLNNKIHYNNAYNNNVVNMNNNHNKKNNNNYESLSKIYNITLKNQANKIIRAYKNYKIKSRQTASQYTNDINLTDILQNTSDYMGNQGKKSGFRIQNNPDGSVIRGYFLNDKVNGWAIFEHKDGSVFKGEYENNRTCGYGEYTSRNKAIYYGNWMGDMQFGIGYEIWNDSSQYNGEYNNGKKEGIGTYIWSDQRTYEGEWKNNNIEGFGIYIYANGKQYSGEWKNNQMNGYGEFTWMEGKKYVGYYKNDKKDGFGIYYWPNNRFFVGFWKCGKQNGIGKYIKGNVIKYGVWKEGKREKWVEEKDFTNDLDSDDDNFIYFFQWNINKLKNFIKVNETKKKDNKSAKFSRNDDTSDDHSASRSRKIKFTEDKEDDDEDD